MADRSGVSVANTIKKYSNQIFGFIKTKVSNTDDAKDILQDVWYQLSRLTNIDDIESMSGWLFRVTKNRITDQYRKKKPEPFTNFELNGDDGDIPFKDILLADDSNNPELAMFKDLFWDELNKALNELPINQKEVFILNEIENMTLQEIADQTATGIKTIISRKGYAVKHLRERLSHLYKELNN
jgi:RNA polymerase sigma factor (sigma-70 family)